MKRLFVFFLLIWAFETVSWAAEPIMPKERFARSSRKRSRSSDFDDTKRGERKADLKKKPYLNFLPFGGAHFLQGKNYMGTALAATQAGSLMLYFDRMQQVRTANDDVAAVMNNGSTTIDAGTFQFLDQNEKYVLQSQKEAQLFLMSFIGLYTFGVVDAVFDPFASYSLSAKKKRKPLDFDRPSRRRDRDRDTDSDDFDDEPGFTRAEPVEGETRVSFLLLPGPKAPMYGLSIKAEL